MFRRRNCVPPPAAAGAQATWAHGRGDTQLVPTVPSPNPAKRQKISKNPNR